MTPEDFKPYQQKLFSFPPHVRAHVAEITVSYLSATGRDDARDAGALRLLLARAMDLVPEIVDTQRDKN